MLGISYRLIKRENENIVLSIHISLNISGVQKKNYSVVSHLSFPEKIRLLIQYPVYTFSITR